MTPTVLTYVQPACAVLFVFFSLSSFLQSLQSLSPLMIDGCQCSGGGSSIVKSKPVIVLKWWQKWPAEMLSPRWWADDVSRSLLSATQLQLTTNAGNSTYSTYTQKLSSSTTTTSTVILSLSLLLLCSGIKWGQIQFQFQFQVILFFLSFSSSLNAVLLQRTYTYKPTVSAPNNPLHCARNTMLIIVCNFWGDCYFSSSLLLFILHYSTAFWSGRFPPTASLCALIKVLTLSLSLPIASVHNWHLYGRTCARFCSLPLSLPSILSFLLSLQPGADQVELSQIKSVSNGHISGQ